MLNFFLRIKKIHPAHWTQPAYFRVCNTKNNPLFYPGRETAHAFSILAARSRLPTINTQHIYIFLKSTHHALSSFNRDSILLVFLFVLRLLSYHTSFSRQGVSTREKQHKLNKGDQRSSPYTRTGGHGENAQGNNGLTVQSLRGPSCSTTRTPSALALLPTPDAVRCE